MVHQLEIAALGHLSKLKVTTRSQWAPRIYAGHVKFSRPKVTASGVPANRGSKQPHGALRTVEGDQLLQ